MFEHRLRIVLIVFITCWLIVILRLFQLQVVKADHYRRVAEARLVRQTKPLQPIRGRILDRKGVLSKQDVLDELEVMKREDEDVARGN